MTDVPVEQIDGLQFLGGIFQEVENDFREMNYEETLRGFRDEISGEQAGHFESRRDSTGSVWPPLAEYTIRKKGHDIPLVETGEMKKSVLDSGHGDHIEGFTHRGLLFGTSDEKAIFHQEGTRKIPARPFIGLSAGLLDKMVDGVADRTVEGLKFKVSR